jgi:hypothetical protein
MVGPEHYRDVLGKSGKDDMKQITLARIGTDERGQRPKSRHLSASCPEGDARGHDCTVIESSNVVTYRLRSAQLRATVTKAVVKKHLYSTIRQQSNLRSFC